MTIYAAFNETEALNGVTADVTNTTTGACVIAGVNRAAVQLVNGAIATANLNAPINEGWVHARVVPRNGSAISGSSADYFLAIVDSDGNRIAGFYQNNTTNGSVLGWRAVYFGDPLVGTGSSEPTTGLFLGTTSNVGYDVDIQFKIANTDGFIRWYVGGSLVREVTGDTQSGSSSNIGSLRLRSLGTSTGASHYLQISQVIVSDEPTIGARLHTLELSAGSVNQWDGSITPVVDTTHDVTTVISEDTVDQEILFACSDVASISSGNEIKALIVSSAALGLPGSPVTKLRGRARVAGTTYNGAEVTLSATFGPVLNIFDTNPATGAKWTLSAANGAELGFQARA